MLDESHVTKGDDLFDAKANRARADDANGHRREAEVSLVSKSSFVIEHVSSRSGERLVTGHERGSLASDARRDLIAPSPVEGKGLVEPDTEIETVRAASRELRARARIGVESDRVSVRIVSATIERERADGTKLRERLDTAELRVGDHLDGPLWARATIVDVSRPAWPEGWLEAVRGATSAWSATPSTRVGSSPLSSSRLVEGCWVLGPFAAADLLRAASWALAVTPPEEGAEIAGAGVRLLDPGFPGRGRGTAFDARGRPTRPLDAIVDGRWRGGPRDAGVVERFGMAVAPSWRDHPVPGWRSLDLRAPRVARPVDTPVVDEVRLLGGTVRALGRVESGGESRGFDVFLPRSVTAWLRLVRGACGPPVLDATGPVVRTPALVIGGTV